MKLKSNLFVVALGILMVMSSIPDVHAKRFGGGRSFGSKQSYSSPFRRSAAPRKSVSQQQAATRNQSLRKGLSRRGGLMGMLGGLALGGLLGSLLFGGAFENFNFFDILIFGGIAWLLYKLFVVRATPESGYRTSADGVKEPGEFRKPTNFQANDAGNARAFETDLLFKKNQNKSDETGSNLEDADFETFAVPQGFDKNAFLAGAKNAYRKLQEAWDCRDLSEIRGLTTDTIFADIKERIDQHGTDNKTEILKLEAELLDVRELDSQTEVTVLFDSILREETDHRPAQVREIWHFIRSINSRQPTWFLDGIQQLED